MSDTRGSLSLKVCNFQLAEMCNFRLELTLGEVRQDPLLDGSGRPLVTGYRTRG